MITNLTLNLAMRISSCEKWSLERFYKQGKLNEFFHFACYGYFYSYPEWGKKWADGKLSEFHRVELACNCCRKKFEKSNYAGVTTVYLMKSNQPRRDFVVFCHSCKQWRDTKPFVTAPKQPLQYQLF